MGLTTQFLTNLMPTFPQKSTASAQSLFGGPLSDQTLVGVACPKRYRLNVTFEMAGADWDFVNKLHAAYRFQDRWPQGMLCHLTGIKDGAIVSQGIWTTEEAESAFFRDVAVGVITAAMHDIGPSEGAHGAMDFEPVARNVDRLILGPLLAKFQDIGADLDATAISCLGTDPVALDTAFHGVTKQQLSEAVHALSLTRAAPEGLILLLNESGTDGVPHQSQFWRSIDEAMSFWENAFLPALIDIGACKSGEQAFEPSIRELKRISVDSAEFDSAWHRA